MSSDNVMEKVETKKIKIAKKKSKQEWPKVAIIILNWNGWKDTVECLESVFRNDYPNYQVIVVDNGSTDGSIEKIQAWADGKQEVLTPEPTHPLYNLSHPPVKKPIPYIYYTREEAEKGGDFKLEEKVTKNGKNKKILNSKELYSTSDYPVIFIQTGENLGFAGGNNVALKMILNKNKNAKGYAWLLNPDMIIEKDTLDKIVTFVYKEGNIIGCTVKNYFNTNEILFYGGAKINFCTGTISFIKKEEDIKKLNYISGGSLFTEIDNFKKIGLLPEEYFLYWEETDWCTKAILNGLILKVCLDAICFDKISTTIGKGYKAEYYYTLGALNYVSKYNSRKIKFVLFADILRIVKRIVNLKIENAKAHHEGGKRFFIKVVLIDIWVIIWLIPINYPKFIDNIDNIDNTNKHI